MVEFDAGVVSVAFGEGGPVAIVVILIAILVTHEHVFGFKHVRKGRGVVTVIAEKEKFNNTTLKKILIFL